MPRAQKLSRQSFLLSEFLEKKAAHFELPKLPVKAVIHGHCHHKAMVAETVKVYALPSVRLDTVAVVDEVLNTCVGVWAHRRGTA